jgi:hypothetical protein
MTRRSQAPSDARQAPRLKLPAMYTLVRVKPIGDERYRWTGYIYDISETGMRLELDAALELGTHVELRAMLPGSQTATVRAQGTVVRFHDDRHEPGPVRMGVVFEKFPHYSDRKRLSEYLLDRGVQPVHAQAA